MARRHPERDLQFAVMKYLRVAAPNVEAIHIPNGGYRRKIEAALLKGMGVKAGVGDILLMWRPGQLAFIELKSAKGRLSPDQQAFSIRMTELEIPYGVCTSIDEVRACLTTWCVPCRDVSG
jgi:hypothetical protein